MDRHVQNAAYVTNVMAKACNEQSGHVRLGQILRGAHPFQHVVKHRSDIGCVVKRVIERCLVSAVDIHDKVEHLIGGDSQTINQL